MSWFWVPDDVWYNASWHISLVKTVPGFCFCPMLWTTTWGRTTRFVSWMHLLTALTLRRLDSSALRPNDKGRPGYDPADLLKLYIYGYLNRIRSSRRLEVETHRNLEAIWLLRQLRPDFKTIADFRRDNRNAFREVFRQFVRLCRELDLYGRELIAVDGTRIKAVNHRGRNFTRARLKTDLQRIDDRLDRYLDQMNEADADDVGRQSGCGD